MTECVVAWLVSRYAKPLLVLLAGVVGCLALVASATASRAPTRAEARAIRRSVAGYAEIPRSPIGKDARIASIEISSVDARYAGVRLTSRTGSHKVMVLHRSFGVWWLQQVGALLGCDTAPKAVLDDLEFACRPPDGVAWISNCSRLQNKPTSIVITCADGNYALVGLRWHTWGSATAAATGTARVNDCTPYCARGHFHDYPVTVTASTLTKCGATPYYDQLTIAYRSSRPRFLPRRDRHVLGC